MNTALKDAAGVGVVRYNGFTFGGSLSTPPTYRLRGEPIYDGAGRAVTHMRYRLDVTSIVYAEAEDATAEKMASVRRQLSRPGRKLELLELGLGDTTVENRATHPDVIWGARPRLLALQPVGGSLAWQVDWQCEFNVSEPGAAASGRNWLAFNYGMRFQIDEQGFTTRTTCGYVQTVQSRGIAGSTIVRQTADRARDALRIRVPYGFRRVESRWNESADKSRIDFSIVDDELRGDPFPPGIVDGRVEFRLHSRPGDPARTTAVLTGWLEAAPNVSKSLAAVRLLAIAQDRASRLAHSPGATAARLVVPSEIEVGHELFTRRSSLRVAYRVTDCLSNLLAGSGLWHPVPGSDYRQWRGNMSRLWSNRGAARLASRADEAVIIDLVDRPTRQITIGNSRSAWRNREPGLHTVGLAPRVTPQASWLDFRVRLRVTRRENAVIHHLACGVVGTAEGFASAGVGAPFRAASGQRESVMEVHGEPTQLVLFEGVAERLKFTPTVPALRSVGGRRVRVIHRVEQRDQPTSLCGLPLHRLQWSVLYEVSGHVASVNVEKITPGARSVRA